MDWVGAPLHFGDDGQPRSKKLPGLFASRIPWGSMCNRRDSSSRIWDLGRWQCLTNRGDSFNFSAYASLLEKGEEVPGCIDAEGGVRMKEGIKAIVVGAAGKMGGRIIHIINETPSIALYRAIERPDHPSIGRDIGEITGLGKIGIPLEGDLKKDGGDVIINFTNPKASIESLEFAKEAGLAIVIGTTGLIPEQMEKVKDLSKSVRCVFSPNMSVGVNVMFRIVQEVAQVLGPEYDIEILEAHHHLKKDSPSGTAVKLGELIAKAMGRDFGQVGIYGRKGMIGERKKDEIGMQVIRAGDIVGEHTVLFGGVGERLEIIHRAHSRDNFARGAVRAALWVVNQPNGLYDMQDVLGLKK
jgi:4-hydroxy-tetrahydrodipicolinate reductase